MPRPDFEFLRRTNRLKGELKTAGEVYELAMSVPLAQRLGLLYRNTFIGHQNSITALAAALAPPASTFWNVKLKYVQRTDEEELPAEMGPVTAHLCATGLLSSA